jgi:hypothetical protein
MDLTRRVVAALLVLQALSVGFMLSLDSLLRVSEGLFAVFLAIDLISFAVMAHTYRLTKIGETPSRYFLLAVLAAVLALLFSSLLVS